MGWRGIRAITTLDARLSANELFTKRFNYYEAEGAAMALAADSGLMARNGDLLEDE